MLKIRLMGTKNDIKWFERILQRQPKVAVTEVSELYRNKGTNRYYRAYVEVQNVGRQIEGDTNCELFFQPLSH